MMRINSRMAPEVLAISPSVETGKLGICHLKRLWSKSLAKRNGTIASDQFGDEWTIDVTLMSAVGIGIEQTLQYLFGKSPSFDEFENWVLSINGGMIAEERITTFNAIILGNSTPKDSPDTVRVLTDADIAFWNENGYIVIHDSVSQENCLSAEQAIWDFLEMEKSDSSTWYKAHPAQQGIMVQFFQHPSLQTNRDSERIRKAFEELWGTQDLWCNTDRVSFNPPETEHYTFPGPRLHWDVSLELPIPLGLQGILYLTDTAADQGALTVVPGFQNRIGDWINSLPPHTNPRNENIEALGAKPIAGKAGDFIIWHQALPHGSRPNTNILPRIAQYICWQPVEPEIKGKWK